MDDTAPPGPGGLRAAIFDTDGVITDTAEAHFRAWKAVFDTFLRSRGAPGEFTRADYLAQVDGVPRLDGVRGFLAGRGITLPEGAEGDDGLDTVRGLATVKNQRFTDWLAENRVPVFEDTLALIAALTSDGIAVGVFSSSRNAPAVLDSAGVRGLFGAMVDGQLAAELGLEPKPAPGPLIECARRLGAAPAETAVFEDATSGTQAGAAGRFGLVVGVNRQTGAARARQHHALRAAGADIVAHDMRQLVLPGGGLRSLARLPAAPRRHGAMRAVTGGRPVAVFLDYDGTLSPIVTDYRKAGLPAPTRAALAALAARVPVAIISGRDRADVASRVGLDDIYYAGSHGFDIAGPGGLTETPEAGAAALAAIATAGPALEAAVAAIPGARVEPKKFSIAVHYREVAPDDVPAVEAAADDVAAAHPALRAGRGKKVIELQPRADWDKGRAVDWLLHNTPMGAGAPLPVYLGDDLTDEDAFAALSGIGLGVAVQGAEDRVTLADFGVPDTDAVREVLAALTPRD
jgi:trehalose 6-phosphate phosphatase